MIAKSFLLEIGAQILCFIIQFYLKQKSTLLFTPFIYSAGAQLALCLAFAAHDAHISLPSQIIAISPPVNMAMDSDADMAAVAPYDIDLTPEFAKAAPRAWLGLPSSPPNTPMPREFLDNPYFNPSAGDPSILAKVGTRLIVASGTWDILHPDIDRWVSTQVENKSGVETTYIVGEEMFHIFPVAIDPAPECRQAAALIVSAVISNGPRK